MAQSDQGHIEASKLGTWSGVFVPNVLTILGVIVFLRLGWVVGVSGLLEALLILALGLAIAGLTGLSLSAISTNDTVGAGGAYYMVSRSLGLEIGGAIGLPLYVAQAIGIAFYLAGFAESLEYLKGWVPGAGPWQEAARTVSPSLVALLALAVFFWMAWRGSVVVLRAQYLVLAVLILSLAAPFVLEPAWAAEAGGAAEGVGGLWSSDYGPGQTFWTVFAVFFPPMTGIMTGVSMSGDLRNPGRSIPRGTFLSLVFTGLVFLALMLWLSARAPRAELATNSMVLADMSRLPWMVYVGIWAATLSSALAVTLAAPRTLAALAADGVLPRALGAIHRSTGEPRRALLLTALLAAAGVWVGQLNALATLLTMFYLATFGTLNAVAALESLVSNPSFRPRFRVHWSLSALGSLACVQAMFLISPPQTVLAALLIAGVYLLLTRRRFETAWGDMRSGFWFAVARLGLLRFSESRQHVRNWRPVLLVMAGNPKSRSRLVEFANCFESRKGLLFLAHVLVGDWERLLPRVAPTREAMEEFARQRRLAAAIEVVIAEDFARGVTTMLQVAGLGQFRPNTVLIGWSDDTVRRAEFTAAVRRILELEKNLLVFRDATDPSLRLDPCIDVWWSARQNGSLMLTLADLLRSNPKWAQHRVRVFRVIAEESARDAMEEAMRQMIGELRVECEVRVLTAEEPVFDTIARVSAGSEVCFVGLALEPSAEGRPVEAGAGPSGALESRPAPGSDGGHGVAVDASAVGASAPASASSLSSQAEPLSMFRPLVERLRGNLFLTKSHLDLRLLVHGPPQPWKAEGKAGVRAESRNEAKPPPASRPGAGGSGGS